MDSRSGSVDDKVHSDHASDVVRAEELIAVIGVRGRSGSAPRRALGAEGHPFVGVQREASKFEVRRRAGRARIADLSDPKALTSSLEDATVAANTEDKAFDISLMRQRPGVRPISVAEWLARIFSPNGVGGAGSTFKPSWGASK